MTATKNRRPRMAPRKTLPARRDGPIEEVIYREILRALSDGSLLPGTKLVEDQVAAAFNVSRERARKVLHRLVHERRLNRVANRGVFVPEPTVAEAREFYGGETEIVLLADLLKGASVVLEKQPRRVHAIPTGNTAGTRLHPLIFARTPRDRVVRLIPISSRAELAFPGL